MVTIIRSVPSRNDNSLDSFKPRCFAIKTFIYDASKATLVPFSVACFLENTKRWQRVKIPLAGAFLRLSGALLQ